MKKLIFLKGEATLVSATDDEIAATNNMVDDGPYVMPNYVTPCGDCSHATANVMVHGRRHAYWCPAFPNGIPAAIWAGENRHTEPYPGDHGIRFEPK